MERLILPLLHLSYVSWLPLNWANRQKDERLVAANGQVLLITAQALLRLGGWERVRHQLVDDVALCRAAKKEGVRVRFVDGYCVAGCRMYRTAAEVWAGFSKNIYPGLGSGVALVFALLLYLAAFVLPYAVLISCWVVPLSAAALQAAVVGVCLNVIVRSALALRFGHSAWAVVLHPLSVLLLSMIAVNSYRWYRTGRVQWTGRTYDLRSGLPSLRAPVPVGSVSTANRSKWMSP
jgi:chlorobactene glucosyltransferase